MKNYLMNLQRILDKIQNLKDDEGKEEALKLLENSRCTLSLICTEQKDRDEILDIIDKVKRNLEK